MTINLPNICDFICTYQEYLYYFHHKECKKRKQQQNKTKQKGKS